MRTIAKPILTIGAILIAVVLTLCVLLNAFLALPSTHDRIRNEIGSAVGLPVSFGSLIGLPYPLGAIRAGNIKAGNPGGITSFSAVSITIHPDLLELLQGRVVASGITIKSPALRIPSIPEPRALPVGLEIGLSGSTPPTPSATVISESAQKPQLSSTSVTSGSTAPHLPLRKIRILGGDFSYIDPKGRPILTLKGVSLEGALTNTKETHWKGSLNAGAAAIGTAVVVRNLKASLTAPEDLSALELSPFAASFGGGTLSGKISLTSLQGIPSYSLSVQLADSRLGKLLADASAGGSTAEGTITGELLLTGNVGNGSTMNGNGNLVCKEVVIEPVSFLKQIGQILNVDELKLLRLAEGKCLFRVDQGRFVVDDLLLRSENLVLAATGPVDSSGELNLDSRLLFNEKLAGRLRGLLGNKLTPAPEQGYSQISFRVTGPALNPKTDLLERLTGIRIGGDLGGIGGFIQGLFGAPKPKPQSAPPIPPTP